jgi:hypothetical protein
MKKGGRFSNWMTAAFNHPSFKATTSTRDLYLDSYARYAENRPNTSQVANAINSGREYHKAGSGIQSRIVTDPFIPHLCYSVLLLAGGLP